MADAENVTRWIVDQQFRDTQIQLGIPLGEFPHANAQLHIYYTLIDKMQNSVLILVLCFFMTVICLYWFAHCDIVMCAAHHNITTSKLAYKCN